MQSRWTDDDSLRRLAEEALEGRTRPPDSGANRDALLHELRVHQTELEMQNEALLDAQLALSELEERYRDLFENAPVGYLVIDGRGKVRMANARAAEILGRARASTIGARLSQFLHPDEAETFEHYRREVLYTRGRLVAEFTMLGAEGRRRDVRLESTCTDADGGQWRVAMTDVTTANNIARKLSHSERLGAVGRHAATVAHDVNNLLFSITGHANVALRSLRPQEPAYASIVRLRNVAERCTTAVQQFASYSRAELDQVSIVDLNATLRELAPSIRPLLGDGVELELELGASDAAVRLDPAHVEQILLSAARNANQAMPQGGTFRIETASVELGGTTHLGGLISARCVRWTMTDTGSGMNEATRQRAFDPFFTTKPAGMGTGLGLSMLAAIVDRAAGVVALESELGRGTSLIIHLPRATGFTNSTPAPDFNPEHRQPFSTVMVVEDNPEARAGLATRLRSAGCDVIPAANGIEALELLRRVADRVRLVVIDAHLPGASMEELLRAIRAQAARVEVLVTPLTGTNGVEVDADDIAGTILRALRSVRFAEG